MLRLLRHTKVTTPSGALVLLLDTGAVIDAEAEAMLQALYSRDPGSVLEHLKMIIAKGAKKFMATFYVGYGHKSIGDCGTVTIFIEGVSMLAAKAIQDTMLYAGQEVSTRYVDFAKARFIEPFKTQYGAGILESLREFYLAARPKLEAHLRGQFPRQVGEKEGIYHKAISARAFDILRGFLPAGASTNLAWHTDLRQAADRILLLRHHPLQEVREVAAAMQNVLRMKYPSSFGHKLYEATEEYNAYWMKKFYYLDDPECPDFELTDYEGIKKELFTADVNRLLAKRPPKTELPKLLGELGTLQFRFLLDFGSFRDVQRQRAVNQRMPLLSFVHDFEPWYLDALSPELRAEAEVFLDYYKRHFLKDAPLIGKFTPEELQYFVPMGYRVANRITGDLPSLVYLAELRATRFVHPTLQVQAKRIADSLEFLFGRYGLNVHVDPELGRFDVRRGEQDIVKK